MHSAFRFHDAGVCRVEKVHAGTLSVCHVERMPRSCRHVERMPPASFIISFLILLLIFFFLSIFVGFRVGELFMNVRCRQCAELVEG